MSSEMSLEMSLEMRPEMRPEMSQVSEPSNTQPGSAERTVPGLKLDNNISLLGRHCDWGPPSQVMQEATPCLCDSTYDIGSAEWNKRYETAVWDDCRNSSATAGVSA